MAAWAKPGVKCVCIRADDFYPQFGETVPVEGSTYTIRDFYEERGAIGIRVEEIVNPPLRYVDGVQECAFNIINFRPLVPPKTQEQDMEIFTPLLDTHKTIQKEKTNEPA